jgi:hypothetical protein
MEASPSNPERALSLSNQSLKGFIWFNSKAISLEKNKFYRVGGKEDENSIWKWSHRSEINKLLDTSGLKNGL